MSSTGERGTHPTPAGGEPALSKRERARKIASLVLIALAIAFAVLNLDEVRVHWIVTTTQTPLIIVIVVSFLAGAALMWLINRQRGQRAKR